MSQPAYTPAIYRRDKRTIVQSRVGFWIEDQKRRPLIVRLREVNTAAGRYWRFHLRQIERRNGSYLVWRAARLEDPF
jgi:hypothetical protein